MRTNSSATTSDDATLQRRPLLEQPLVLREEIRWHIRGHANAAVLEDPIAGKHYRLGPGEYRFVVHADRARCFAEAWRRFEALRANGTPSITQAQGETVYAWLIASGCSESASSPTSRSRRPFWRRVNPLIFRLSLGNPDRLLTMLARATKRVSARSTAIGLGILLLTAVWILLANLGQFVADVDQLITADRVVVLCGMWSLLKVIHELGHGLMCKRFGGRVTDVGVAFVLFAPVAYTDVSSSNAFPSRWRRLAVVLAGITFEICAAAVAILAWRVAESPDIRRAAVDAALMASVTTLAFNANPLMRFDGYFVLVECLGIENLYEQGQLRMRRLLHCVCFASPRQAMDFSGRSLALAGYGLACWLWRFGLGVMLVVASASLFHGAGWLLAAFAVGIWFIAPVVDSIRGFLRAPPWQPQGRISVSLRLAGLAVVGVALCLAPPPVFSTAPAVVQADPPAVIRCHTAGFVQAVHVHDGQQVHIGDPVATLYSHQLSSELATVEAEWQLARQQERSCQWRGDASQLVSARDNVERLRGIRAELQQREARLVIRAKADGAIAAHRIRDLEGAYLREGESIGEVGTPESKRLVVSLVPAEADRLALGSRVRAMTACGRRLEGTVTRVDPRAGVDPPHPAIVAIHDGPIAVRPGEDDRSQFVHPRVTAYVDLPPASSRRLRSGQTCTLLLGPKSETFFGWTVDWLQNKLSF